MPRSGEDWRITNATVLAFQRPPLFPAEWRMLGYPAFLLMLLASDLRHVKGSINYHKPITQVPTMMTLHFWHQHTSSLENMNDTSGLGIQLTSWVFSKQRALYYFGIQSCLPAGSALSPGGWYSPQPPPSKEQYLQGVGTKGREKGLHRSLTKERN